MRTVHCAQLVIGKCQGQEIYLSTSGGFISFSIFTICYKHHKRSEKFFYSGGMTRQGRKSEN